MVNLNKSALEKAPRFSKDSEPTFDRTYGREVYDYYGVHIRSNDGSAGAPVYTLRHRRPVYLGQIWYRIGVTSG